MQPRHIRLPSWVGGSTVIFCMVDAYSKSSRLFVSLSITTDLSYLDIQDFSYWIVVVQLDLCPTGKKSQTKVMHQSFLLMISFGGILSSQSTEGWNGHNYNRKWNTFAPDVISLQLPDNNDNTLFNLKIIYDYFTHNYRSYIFTWKTRLLLCTPQWDVETSLAINGDSLFIPPNICPLK